MKKIFLLYILVFVFTSCNKDFDTINNNIKAAEKVPASTLLSNGQRELVDNITTPNVNSNIFRLLAQQWAETTYADETQYNLTTRNIPRFFWNPMYRDVLKDLSESKRILVADVSFTNPKLKAAEIAITEFMTVYAYSVLVDTFGDIPYSEALDATKPTPKYDDAATIYADLLSRLDAALGDMTDLDVDILDPIYGDPAFAAGDLIYGGNVAKWIKFGNSLKLRLGMTISDVDPTTAKKVVEAAASKAFTSNADNAIFKYQASPPNTNPVWVNLIQSQRIDFVAANTFIDKVKPLNDPRLPFYFNTIDGDYLGGKYGSVNNNANFSLPSDKITAPDFPADILDYADVEFYLAEAIEKGFAVDGTAETHYNKAITASILYWGGTSGDAATYLANPEVAYPTAAGTYKQKIGTQKWIALYNRGFEAWTEYRRLDYPVLNVVAAADVQGPFPVRFPYSDQEPNLNKAHYDEASAKIHGDLPTTKLFWDVP